MHSAFSAANEIITLRGFNLEESKDQPPAPSISLLVSTLTLHDGHVTTALTPVRMANLSRELKLRLDKDTLKPGAASKLRGEISFATSLLAGRYGRALLGPIKARQQQREEDMRTLSQPLQQTLQWRLDFLPRVPPRTVQLRHTNPAFAHADASGPGHRGIVSIDNRITTFTHCHAPQRLCKDPATSICDCEVLASLLALVATAPDAQRLLLFSDNQPCIAALVTARTDTPAANASVQNEAPTSRWST